MCLLKDLVFLRLIIKFKHDDEDWLSSVCKFWVEWAMSAASSANRRSLIAQYSDFVLLSDLQVWKVSIDFLYGA